MYSHDLLDSATYGVMILIGVILVFMIVIAPLLTYRYLHLKTVPGPRWAPFTRLWLLRTLASEDSANIYKKVNQKYGPLARIGPNHVIVSEPEAIRNILGTHSAYTRGPWYNSLRLDPLNANLITERDESKHQKLRRRMAGGYSGKGIDSIEPIVEERIKEWINYIKNHVVSEDEGTVKFDMAPSVQYLTTDVISHLCFGHPFGFVKKHGDVHGFLNTLETRLPIIENLSVITELGHVLTLIAKIPFLNRMLLPQPTDTDGIGKIVGISKSVVDKRFAPNAKERNDILGSFIKNGIPREQIQSEITIALFAGSDTTASGLRGTLLHILSNPLVYWKLKKEIKDAEKEGRISNPILDSEAQKLPYLQACIKEGLRIFPPITALRERVVPEGGDTLLGHYLPGGTNVGINMAQSLLDPVFGADADVYRPERWLDQDPFRLEAMEKVHELVFGHGNTRCLGIRLAKMTLNKVLVTLLRDLNLTIASPIKPWNSRCHGIFFQRDFWLRITKGSDIES
ncbi:putative benzoate 4-monooxygenase cytochrome P450 [Delitschia confertaspora ATCC 74209]|uniref:Benzoate 4-monooxygenase cytochrome P450 n=1 Tax=Delitschia confertaspora ATCC 74209 TaxID=1513339 RepID=A0A9P4JE94_9PLEO|nr:putative benzoate 4-monooxygenase cytochrome P450 [Delitschia confertaspora ATCC 74209]